MAIENQEKIKEDIGFNVNVSKKIIRLINKDGSFNVNKLGLSKLESKSIYNIMLTIPWWKFNLFVLVSYIVINTIFACIYSLIGFEHLGGLLGNTFFEKWLDTFFFSAQTLTTVGYGRINPIGFGTSTVAMFESMMGLLGFALATGILYGRFSRPVAKIRFSKNALITPYKDISAVMFRIANERENQLIDLDVQVIVSILTYKNGKEMRDFRGLELERNKVSFFPSSWTVVHPIDKESALFDMDFEELMARKPEFLIIVKGYDDVFSTNVHTRMSYTYDELLWNHKFIDIHSFDEDGKTTIDVSRLNETIKL
ncbi:MAG: ion channel [Bacteroidota bacterium]